MAGLFKIKMAFTGPGNKEVLRVEWVVYESDHRREDMLIDELGLNKVQTVVTLAIRESRKARKNEEEEESQQSHDTDERTRPRAGVGQSGPGRGRAQASCDNEKKGRRLGGVWPERREARRRRGSHPSGLGKPVRVEWGGGGVSVSRMCL